MNEKRTNYERYKQNFLLMGVRYEDCAVYIG